MDDEKSKSKDDSRQRVHSFRIKRKLQKINDERIRNSAESIADEELHGKKRIKLIADDVSNEQLV